MNISKTAEAEHLFRISLGKLECMKATRVSKSLHKNLLVSTVFNKVISIVSDVEELVLDSTCALTSSASPVVKSAVDSGSNYNSSDADLDTTEKSPGSGSAPVAQSGPNPAISHQERLPSVATSMRNEADDTKNGESHNHGVKRSSSCDDGAVEFSSKRRRSNFDVEPSDSVCHWRASPVEHSDMEDDSDCEMDTESETRSPVVMYRDENIATNAPVDIQQISSLVTVFSSSFRGLGDLEGYVESSALVPKSRDESASTCDLTSTEPAAQPPLRRVNSVPNLSINVQPRPKKKSSLLVLRL